MKNISKNKLIKPEENSNALVETKNALTEVDHWRKVFSTPVTAENILLKEYIELHKLKKRSKEQEERELEVMRELATINGLHNGNLLQSIANNRKDFQMLAKIKQGLMDEYQCKATTELMLVDRITRAYWQGMWYERCLNRIIEQECGRFYYDDSRVKILKELHKGIDLANRQFETGITLLKNLKQPKLNIKVMADNAYLAQNQQVVNKGESLKPNDLGEIHEANN